ncbi:type III-B CRISPR module-associated protein Cmr3 [Fervidobacterium sp. 2310opik-2]|uniref:type III-B CRISPR module-associated protein Cmr3 n=1 Tax=Fervidobacterium sp. 2310opik-2 TaxID=1755815 RepID=UPI0013DFC77E|nr:type III-B CRISPR module-associated protein Cmr3 [Fervidobacterium sp. 2310opik-2]KAF2961061.1 hypothetical protein AS161_03540 [Fervidobacterium sp. 2310opik-2]
MSLYAIYFEPEDWVSFREVRRFGPSDIVKTVFPSPLPFYGAIRSALLKELGINLEYHKKPAITKEIEDLIGTKDDPGKIKLYGPYIYSEVNGVKKHYFPAPKNIYKKGDEYKKMVYLDGKAGIEELDLQLAWIPTTDNTEPDEYFIELEELAKLQKNEPFKLSNPDNFTIEAKYGVGLKRNEKSTEEGLIYTMNLYRFKNGGFFMITDCEETVELVKKLEGVFLGAKQRWAKISIEQFPDDIFKEPERKNSDIVEIMLITPAIYEDGIAPKDLNFGEVKIKAIAAGKKIPISGWDYEIGIPKTLYHAVTPGTVYYLSGMPKNRITVLSQSKLNQFGFGRFIYL